MGTYTYGAEVSKLVEFSVQAKANQCDDSELFSDSYGRNFFSINKSQFRFKAKIINERIPSENDE